MPLVKELLVDHWGLFTPFRPHLAISLIGGAKNFRMEGKKKETFKQVNNLHMAVIWIWEHVHVKSQLQQHF